MAEDWLEEEIDTEVSYGDGPIPAQYESAQDVQITQNLQNTLGAQHAIHGLIGHAFERIGGAPRFVKWADEHETHFYKMLFASTPGMQPTTGFQGEVNLHIHNTLIPSDLDD